MTIEEESVGVEADLTEEPSSERDYQERQQRKSCLPRFSVARQASRQTGLGRG